MYFVSAQNPPKVLNNHSDVAAAAAAAAIGSSSSDRQEPLNCRPRCRCSRKQEEKLLILDAAPDRARRPKQSLAATRKHVLFRPPAPPGSVMHNGWTGSERRCPPTTSAVSREGGSWAQRWRWNGILKVMVPHGVCGKKKKSVKWTCEIVPVCVVLASTSVFSCCCCCCCYCCCISSLHVWIQFLIQTSSANPKSCHQHQPLYLMTFFSCSVSCFANKTASTCQIWWTLRRSKGIKMLWLAAEDEEGTLGRLSVDLNHFANKLIFFFSSISVIPIIAFPFYRGGKFPFARPPLNCLYTY